MRNQKEKPYVVSIYKRQREICHKFVDDIFDSGDQDIIETMRVNLLAYMSCIQVNKTCCDRIEALKSQIKVTKEKIDILEREI